MTLGDRIGRLRSNLSLLWVLQGRVRREIVRGGFGGTYLSSTNRMWVLSLSAGDSDIGSHKEPATLSSGSTCSRGGVGKSPFPALRATCIGMVTVALVPTDTVDSISICPCMRARSCIPLLVDWRTMLGGNMPVCRLSILDRCLRRAWQ